MHIQQFHTAIARILGVALLGVASVGVSHSASKLEFEYSIEVAADRAADGAQRIRSDHILRTGDRFRVAFSSKFNAFVYLFARGDSESNYTRLFPHSEIEASNLVRPNFEVRVPDRGGWLALDERPGVERLVMVVSNRAQPDLEEVGEEVERDRLDRIISQLHLTRSNGKVQTKELDSGWTRLRFQGRPERIVHVRHIYLTHHLR